MLANQLIQHLLEIKAIELRQDRESWFTWTSGIKSPIYCDNRLIISYPHVRRLVASAMVDLIKNKYPDVDVIAGTATAGIPHAAWVSELLNLPMVYVRDKVKTHGKTNQIEGKLLPNQKVVIIEDLISTGKSSINVAQALREQQVEVLGVIAIFSYNLDKANSNFKEHNLEVTTISNYDYLIKQATQTGLVDTTQAQILLNWRDEL